jgi:hypothetical protein
MVEFLEIRKVGRLVVILNSNRRERNGDFTPFPEGIETVTKKPGTGTGMGTGTSCWISALARECECMYEASNCRQFDFIHYTTPPGF